MKRQASVVIAVGVMALAGTAGATTKHQRAVNQGKAMIAWMAKVKTDYQALSGDFTAIRNDAGAQTVTQMALDCEALAIDATALQNDRPMPVKNINKLFQKALGDFARGGHECENGIADTTSIELGAAITSVQNGNTAFEKAATLVTVLARKVKG